MNVSVSRALSDLGLIAEQQLELTAKGDIESAIQCQQLFHAELDVVLQRLEPADYQDAIPQLERMQDIFRDAHETAENIMRLRAKDAHLSRQQHQRGASYAEAGGAEAGGRD